MIISKAVTIPYGAFSIGIIVKLDCLWLYSLKDTGESAAE